MGGYKDDWEGGKETHSIEEEVFMRGDIALYPGVKKEYLKPMTLKKGMKKRRDEGTTGGRDPILLAKKREVACKVRKSQRRKGGRGFLGVFEWQGEILPSSRRGGIPQRAPGKGDPIAKG